MHRSSKRVHGQIISAAALAASLSLGLPGHAAAQEAEERSGGLAEIVVTAQRREENLQDVPIAVNAITSDSLRNMGISDTNSLVQAVPSLNFTRSGTSGIFVIRGVATLNGAAGEEGSTAVYVDDVYMPDLTSTINKFNNIERVEVLNGPQGTLFGRNAVGGLIRIITSDPGDRMEFRGQLGVANYDIFSGQAYFSTPLTEDIGWNIAFTGQDQGKGLGHNPTLNKSVRKDNYWGVRSKLVARPSDNLKITLTGEYNKNEDDTSVWTFPITAAVPSSQGSPSGDPNFVNIRQWGVSGKAELDLDFATLTSISSYRLLKLNSRFDVDAQPIVGFYLINFNETKTFQQEVRLASATTEPLSWQVGAFYLHGITIQDQIQTGAFLQGATRHIVAKGVTDSISLFGEVTYSITPTTHLTGGVRWTSEKRKLPRGYQDTLVGGNVVGHLTNVLDSLKFDELTYRAAVRQEVNEDLNVYASVNRGFKSGQFNLQTPYQAPVKPETIMAYEIGLKGDLLDRRLRMSLAAFHYDIDDYQIRSAPGGVSALRNAAKVKIDGVDFNAEAAVSDQLSLTVGASYLDAKYDSFPDSTSGDASGNRTIVSPKFTFNANGTYVIPFDNGSELRLTGSYIHKSTQFFEEANVLVQPAYDVFTASAEYSVNENFAFEVYMRNIGNERYNVQEQTAIGSYGLAGEPRKYGLNVKITY